MPHNLGTFQSSLPPLLPRFSVHFSFIHILKALLKNPLHKIMQSRASTCLLGFHPTAEGRKGRLRPMDRCEGQVCGQETAMGRKAGDPCEPVSLVGDSITSRNQGGQLPHPGCVHVCPHASTRVHPCPHAAMHLLIFWTLNLKERFEFTPLPAQGWSPSSPDHWSPWRSR